MKEESEFGSGLIICLTKFSEHLHFGDRKIRQIHAVDRWIKTGMKDEINSDSSDIEYFKKVELAVRGDPEKALSDVIHIWANGATDHLYEIRVPTRWNNTYIAKLVRELKDIGLTMGHGFTEKTWTTKDLDKLRRLTRRISLAIDRKIGIKNGDEGRW